MIDLMFSQFSLNIEIFRRRVLCKNIYYEAIELQNTGFIKFPLTYAEELKQIKFAERRNIEELSQQIEDNFEYYPFM